MNRKQYENKRRELMNELETIMNADTLDQDAFNAKKAEIEALDASWEAYAQAQADMNALNDHAPSVAPVVDLTTGESRTTAPTVTDLYATDDYRNAFMNFCVKGQRIPEQYRNDAAATGLSDIDGGAVISTTIVREIIREMKVRGEIWAKVRKLNIQGGVEFPIVDVMPVATWVGEGSQDSQKLTSDTKVVFSYHGLECKLAQSLLVSVVTIAEFEALFTQLAVEAIIAALEKGVFNGSGSGEMLGILNETRIPVGNTIELTAEDLTWKGWKQKVFTKMKKAYRNGDFFMAQATFDGYIDGMTDTTGQPIGRVNYGIDGNEVYRFAGKNVVTVEEDILKDWDSADAGDVVAVFGNLSNYAVNSNLEMRTVKWIDENTNKVYNKVIMICDGKVLDPNGFLIIKKAGDDSE